MTIYDALKARHAKLTADIAHWQALPGRAAQRKVDELVNQRATVKAKLERDWRHDADDCPRCIALGITDLDAEVAKRKAMMFPRDYCDRCAGREGMALCLPCQRDLLAGRWRY